MKQTVFDKIQWQGNARAMAESLLKEHIPSPMRGLAMRKIEEYVKENNITTVSEQTLRDAFKQFTGKALAD